MRVFIFFLIFGLYSLANATSDIPWTSGGGFVVNPGQFTKPQLRQFVNQVRKTTPYALRTIQNRSKLPPEIHKKVFGENKPIYDKVASAQIDIVDGPCKARDNSERDASIISDSADICMSLSRIVSKIDRANAYIMVLALLIKEYGRLAGLNDEEAESLQNVILKQNFSLQSFVYQKKLLDHVFLHNKTILERIIDQLVFKTSDTELCSIIGNLTLHSDSAFLRFQSGLVDFENIENYDTLGLIMVSFASYALSQFCKSYAEEQADIVNILEIYDGRSLILILDTTEPLNFTGRKPLTVEEIDGIKKTDLYYSLAFLRIFKFEMGDRDKLYLAVKSLRSTLNDLKNSSFNLPEL